MLKSNNEAKAKTPFHYCSLYFRDILIENDYGIIRIWGACRIRRGFRNVEELLYR